MRTQPIKPSEPKKTLTATKVVSSYYCMTSNKIPLTAIDKNAEYMIFRHYYEYEGGYSDYYIDFCVDETTPNENYEKQLEKYKKRLAKYEKDLKKYQEYKKKQEEKSKEKRLKLYNKLKKEFDGQKSGKTTH